MGCLSDLVWEMDAPGNGLLVFVVVYFKQFINKNKGKAEMTSLTVHCVGLFSFKVNTESSLKHQSQDTPGTYRGGASTTWEPGTRRGAREGTRRAWT